MLGINHVISELVQDTGYDIPRDFADRARGVAPLAIVANPKFAPTIPS
jgi:hypothetical protein